VQTSLTLTCARRRFGCDWTGGFYWLSGCAQLRGAYLSGAQLQGANLSQAGLRGAALVNAQLQGAALDLAKLQGASLDGAQLQGANLFGAGLGGASLDLAQLQGANLDFTQLQGASLFHAQLQGASLRDDYVWRTNPPSNTNGAFIDAPEPGPKYSGLDCPIDKEPCDWSERSYATLRSLIETSVPLVDLRDQALQRIATLEKPPYVADEGSAKAWTDLANESARSAGSYVNTLAKMFEKIGCAADGAPYVIGALTTRLYRFGRNPSEQAEVAAAFLDEAKCPGAHGLSEENRAKLREIRDRGLPAPPGPGTAAR